MELVEEPDLCQWAAQSCHGEGLGEVVVVHSLRLGHIEVSVRYSLEEAACDQTVHWVARFFVLASATAEALAL